MTRWKERNIGRSSKTADFPVTTYLSMEDDSPLLHIRVNFDNTAKDHRLRILFPTDILTDTHFADSVFDVIERPDIPGKNWTNPSRCQRMQYFAAAEDSVGGLAVINRGFYEYEILPERKQIAVTLMRAVGEMGDWGVFPTPDAQDPGPFEAELSVLVYAGNSFRENGCREAVQFQNDLSVFQIRNSSGSLPERGNLLNCSGTGLSFSALKPSEDGKGLILRAVNVTGTSTMLNMIPPAGCVCYESSIIEQKGKRIEADKTGQIHVPVGKKEIKTIRIEMY